MTPSLNIIGAGNVGQTLGYLLLKQGVVRLGSICNSSNESSHRAIQFMGGGTCCSFIRDLPPADLTLITTPDAMISSVCTELSANKYLKSGSIVMHCSGALTAEALISVQLKGCYTASLHPMRSFANPSLSIQHYAGTYCAMEGDSTAISVLQALFHAIGSITCLINPDKKTLYHAAGVYASNYLVVLAELASTCLAEAGVDKQHAVSAISTLMHSTLSNLEATRSPAQSLTGPIKRGDKETIQLHLKALQTNTQHQVYRTLGTAALELTTLDDNTKRAIEQMLRT
jgi:predicted short-subunit dehydrogenase-like oxidoreductase (DUF2520 family)